MQRVPMAEFEPALKKRLEELWGTPPNLYRALANHPKIIAAWSEFAATLRQLRKDMPHEENEHAPDRSVA